MNVLGSLWVAEYSAEQDCFNVTTLDTALLANASMVTDKQNNDYLVFGLFSNIEQANAACDKMRTAQGKPKELAAHV